MSGGGGTGGAGRADGAPPQAGQGAPDGAGVVVHRLWLVRHGQTSWNRERRIQGQIDVGLTEQGHAQAEAVAQRLGAAFAGRPGRVAVVTSDLRRALDTAQPIARALGATVRPDPRWRERHYGVFQGMSHVQIADAAQALRARWSGRAPDDALDGGESLLALRGRIVAAMHACLPAVAADVLDTVAVTHGGALDMVRRIVTGMALQAERDFDLPNAALYRVDAVADGPGDGAGRCGGTPAMRWRLGVWADTAHLGCGVLAAGAGPAAGAVPTVHDDSDVGDR